MYEDCRRTCPRPRHYDFVESNLPPNPSTVNGTTSARRAEVVWRGHITASIADFVNRRIYLVLDLGGGMRQAISTNATTRLKDHFATYIGISATPSASVTAVLKP